MDSGMSTLFAERGATKSFLHEGLVLACVLITISMRSITYAQQFQVTGVLEKERLFNGKITQQYPVSEFRIYVDGCNWYIYVKPGGTWEDGQLEMAYDGEYIRGIGTGGSLTSIAGIYNGNTPPILTENRLPLLWTAFAAGCYLREAALTGKLLPPEEMTRTPIPARVDWMDTGDNLPARIIYFDDGTNRMQGKPVPHPPPFDKGYTNAVYKVTEYTNIGRLKLPLRFEFDQFFPRGVHIVSSNDISVGLHLEGKVLTAAARCDVQSFTPALPSSGIHVADGRFLVPEVASTYFRYRTNRWLSKSEVTAVPGFTNYLQRIAIEAKLEPALVNVNAHGAARLSGDSKHNHAFMIWVSAAALFMLVLLFRWPRRVRPSTIKQ